MAGAEAERRHPLTTTPPLPRPLALIALTSHRASIAGTLLSASTLPSRPFAPITATSAPSLFPPARGSSPGCSGGLRERIRVKEETQADGA